MGTGRYLAARPIAALAVPVAVGIAWLLLAGAPALNPLVNATALIAAAALAFLLRAPQDAGKATILAVVLAAGLFLPLVTGPETNGIARWLPIGPMRLHAGMLLLPAIVVLSARDEEYGPAIMGVALLAAFLQPDAATGFAVTFAAAGLHDTSRDWKMGLVATVGFFASLIMAVRGELPPVEFVERVFVDAASISVWAAMLLAGSLAVWFWLVLFKLPMTRAERFGLAGSMFGFTLMALVSHYPTPLVGYGVAPILGYGLAFGLARGTPR